MTKTKLGALLLSLASVCAIAATSVGTTYQTVAEENTATETVVEETTETTETTENEVTSSDGTEYGQIEIAALEKYYAEQIGSDEMMGATNGYMAQDGWKGQTINPAFDDVTISYDYSRLKNYNIGFGFRIALGDKCMAINRWTGRITMYRIDDADGTLNVKVNAPSYYEKIPTDNASVYYKNRLGTKKTISGTSYSDSTEIYVNTGEYYDLPKTVDSAYDGVNILSGGLYSVYWNDGKDSSLTSTTWTFSLRKITKEDGTVVFRYYENGNYVFELQFEDEVTGYAPNSKSYSDSCNKFDNFKVTLGDKYTDADAARDELTGGSAVKLDVGESLTATYTTTWGAESGAYPAMFFTYTDANEPATYIGDGVLIYRFSKRMAIAGKSDVQTKKYDGSQSVYLDVKQTGGVYGGVNDEGAVYSITGSDSTSNIASGYTTLALSTKGSVRTYTITRLQNITVGDEAKGYSLYSIYEKETTAAGVSTDRHICNIGLPVSKGDVSVMLALYSSHSTSTFQTDYHTSAIKEALENKEPAATTTDFTDTYAQTVDGASVRFSLGTSGLRFNATASEEFITAMRGYYGTDNVSFGVKLVRGDGAYAYIEAKNYTLANGVYTFNGVVSNIKAEHYATDYTPYVYVRYIDGEGATHVIETLAGEAANIRAVAQAVLADVTSAADATHIYPVSIDGTATVYSPYTQAQIDVAKGFAQEQQEQS